MTLPAATPPLEIVTEGIGFKDWAVICDALGSGRQSLILRKGGIAEGRDGFRFKHERFFLFPTGFHQQHDMIRPGESVFLTTPAATDAETVVIRFLFVLEFAYLITDFSLLARLEPFHIWREAVVRERFEYDDERGLQCAFGRVYRTAIPWTFLNKPAYGGCRSWVNLPEPPNRLEFTPILDHHEHRRRKHEIERIVTLRA